VKENEVVPVVDQENKPLMPCSEKRARLLMERKQAVHFWKFGIFCIRLTKEPSSRVFQDLSVGIDPGSKREGFTAKTATKTVINLLVDAVTWVRDHVETRRIMRRSRRNRKTPCRKPRFNNRKGPFMAPSTRARWDLKLRVLKILYKILPITKVVVEDVSAMSKKNCRKWNKNFSPIEVGKKWFYASIEGLGLNLSLKQGYETKELRDLLGLKKTSKKLAETFEAHNVDSWVLANSVFNSKKPESRKIHRLVPLEYHRRMLHRMIPSRGGSRPVYGGTRSMDLRRGSLVRHPKFGLTYVGGSSSNRISLHNLKDGKRLTKSSKREDLKVLAYNSWRFYQVPSTTGSYIRSH
jgi:RRXRR protein